MSRPAPTSAVLDEIWSSLEEQLAGSDQDHVRVYRRLELEPESGLRLGVASPESVLELLVEVGPATYGSSISPPRWRGMRFETIVLDIPDEDTTHIRLYLKDQEHRPVFASVCSDIVRTLLEVDSPQNRTRELQGCIDRWSRFFQRHGLEGLSREAQQGLFGELTWLELLLSQGMNPLTAVESWRGCRRGYHDFEDGGRVVEVKTTMTKEPRRVRISNERQLDDRGLESLHLFVLTLHRVNSGGTSLPGLIGPIRDSLSGHVSALSSLEKGLKEAGYLDAQGHIYTSGYIRRKQEAFRIEEGFPRIVDVPGGVGSLSYTLTISACSAYEVAVTEALVAFIGGEDHR